MTTPAQLFRIRPLAWERITGGIYRAESSLGRMYAERDGKLWMFWCTDHNANQRNLDTLEAAQLAASQWHRERLAADLIEVTTD